MPVDPDPRLLSLPDPYDPSVNAPYRLHDASLFNGRYYLYYGPTPALVLFVPFKIATGLDLPQPMTIAFFCSAGLLFAFLLLEHVTRWSLARSPSTLVRVTALLTLGLSSTVPFLLRRPDMYEVAIASGYAFVFASAWAYAVGGLTDRPRIGWLALGSALLGSGRWVASPRFCGGTDPAGDRGLLAVVGACAGDTRPRRDALGSLRAVRDLWVPARRV